MRYIQTVKRAAEPRLSNYTQNDFRAFPSIFAGLNRVRPVLFD